MTKTSLCIIPLSPSIHIQILQTDFCTLNYQSSFPLLLILLILVAFSLDSVLKLFGEK